MSNIQLVVVKDPQEAAVRAAALIGKAIEAKPRPVIGLATGTQSFLPCPGPQRLYFSYIFIVALLLSRRSSFSVVTRRVFLSSPPVLRLDNL